MSLFPLDTIRNAIPDQRIEPYLQQVRTMLSGIAFADDLGGTEAVIDAFDAARPRLNVIAHLLEGSATGAGADISTGLGFLPVVLQMLGISVIATEVQPATAHFAATAGIEIHQYHIGRDHPPFAAGSLDFLVFGEVLEHLKAAPVPVLSELAALLRPGGRFILTTPNIARLAHIEALAAGENFLEPFPQDLPPTRDATDFLEHVREYSAREVVDAVESAGLGVDTVLMTGWGEAGYALHPNPYSNDIFVVVATR